MFGKRKGPGRPSEPSAPLLPETAGPNTNSPGANLPSANPVGGPPAAGAAPQKPAAAASAPVPKPVPRRPASAVEGRKLVVGREICLSGEIKTCEKLVVEGRVEADLRDSQSLEISEPGLFKGNATVEDCEISGTFEGDLTVTGLLVVLPTGRVSGRIRYAEMELARGARVTGDIDVLDDAALRRARGDGPKLAHDNSILAGDGKSQIG